MVDRSYSPPPIIVCSEGPPNRRKLYSYFYRILFCNVIYNLLLFRVPLALFASFFLIRGLKLSILKNTSVCLGPVLLPRVESRILLLPTEGRPHLQQARRIHPPGVLEARISGGQFLNVTPIPENRELKLTSKGYQGPRS